MIRAKAAYKRKIEDQLSDGNPWGAVGGDTAADQLQGQQQLQHRHLTGRV